MLSDSSKKAVKGPRKPIKLFSSKKYQKHIIVHNLYQILRPLILPEDNFQYEKYTFFNSFVEISTSHSDPLVRNGVQKTYLKKKNFSLH